MSEAKIYKRVAIASENVEFDTPSQDVDHGRVRETGIALPDARGIEIEPPTRNVAEALSNEAFMQQMLEVTFADPGNENEHQFVEGGLNGEKFCFRRGDTVKVKRCHLAVIANAKQERLKQTKVTAADGSMGYEERMVLQPVYPFQVTYDPAGQRGISWVRQVLQRS
jgi:hypothetical protein